MYVGSEGVAHNHHFLPPSDGNKFEFLSGDYLIEIFARIVGKKRTLKLAEMRLSLGDEQAKRMQSKDTAIMFDWGPDSQRYIPLLRNKPRISSNLFEKLFQEHDSPK